MSSQDSPPAAKPGIDADAVRELAKLLQETGLTEIEIEHNGARIRVSRGAAGSPALAAPAAAIPGPAPAAQGAAPTVSGLPAGAVACPMVGTVYLAPEPGRPNFVSIGKTVRQGETLFIIEAMKTMNAIAAPRAGLVREICVADATPVEFGQILCILA